MKLIKFKELSKKLGGRSRSSVDRDMKKRGFPTPIKIGRSVAWDEEAVDRWLQEQALEPYQPKPVAVPGPGKRRGRPSRADKTVKSNDTVIVQDALTTNSEIDKIKQRFKIAMMRAGVTPPKKIVADGNLHLVDDNYETGYYVLNLEKFPVGTYGCAKKQIYKRWAGKLFHKMDFQEQHYYEKEKSRMKKLRKKAEQDWLGQMQ